MDRLKQLVHHLTYLFDPAGRDGVTDNAPDIPGWVAAVILILIAGIILLFAAAVFT